MLIEGGRFLLFNVLFLSRLLVLSLKCHPFRLESNTNQLQTKVISCLLASDLLVRKRQNNNKYKQDIK